MLKVTLKWKYPLLEALNNKNNTHPINTETISHSARGTKDVEDKKLIKNKSRGRRVLGKKEAARLGFACRAEIWGRENESQSAFRFLYKLEAARIEQHETSNAQSR